MSDTTDIALTDSDAPELHDEQGRREEARTALRRRTLLAALLMLLLLFGCAIFWPVPESARQDGSDDARTGPGRVLTTITDATARPVDDVTVRGGKGYALLVEATLQNDGDARTFDQNWLGLEFDGIRVPPLSLAHEGVVRHARQPDELGKGETARVSAVFAAPFASVEATLVLLPGDVPHDQASTYVLMLGGDSRP